MAKAGTAEGAPLSAPPGLDVDSSSADSASATSTDAGPQYSAMVEGIRQDVEQKMAKNELNCLMVEEVKRAVLQDVDARMAEKVDALWKKGQQTVKAFQEKQNKKTQALAEELAACKKKQEAMEAEHEKLKALLASLAQRFAMLGAVFNGGPGEASNAEGFAPHTPQQEGQTPDFMTPYPTPLDGGLESHPSGSPLPAVPAFPFPAPQHPQDFPPGGSTVATLSLADAIGSEAAMKAPLSLANKLAPKSPRSGKDGDTKNIRFSFTLRKADGASLGLDVSHPNNGKVLQVEGVLPGGAVEAWNRQCANGQPDRAIMKGDRIVAVNNVTGEAVRMLQECKENQLLKLVVSRGGSAEDDESSVLTGTPERKDAAKAAGLHAGAPAFVPSPGSPTPNVAPKSPGPEKTPERNFSFNAEAKAFVPGKP